MSESTNNHWTGSQLKKTLLIVGGITILLGAGLTLTQTEKNVWIGFAFAALGGILCIAAIRDEFVLAYDKLKIKITNKESSKPEQPEGQSPTDSTIDGIPPSPTSSSSHEKKSQTQSDS